MSTFSNDAHDHSNPFDLDDVVAYVDGLIAHIDRAGLAPDCPAWRDADYEAIFMADADQRAAVLDRVYGPMLDTLLAQRDLLEAAVRDMRTRLRIGAAKRARTA